MGRLRRPQVSFHSKQEVLVTIRPFIQDYVRLDTCSRLVVDRHHHETNVTFSQLRITHTIMHASNLCFAAKWSAR